jgi:ribosome-binding protein aMBF1 (putative translation factor)
MLSEKKRRPGRPSGTGAPQSDAVRRVRTALELTQEELAAELKCSVWTVVKMENLKRLPGKKDILTRLETLAEKAGVDLKSGVTA